MSEVVLKFASEDQYKKFIEKVKEDVLSEMSQRRAYPNAWLSIRYELESRFENGYGKESFPYYDQFQQTISGAVRLAFKRRYVKELHGINENEIRSFTSELFALIDKYRNNQE